MTTTASAFLSKERLDALAAKISPNSARPCRDPGDIGDTTWFGAIDSAGRAVSVIQSLYHEYGSGIVLQDTGIVWQNRGISFSLQPDTPRRYTGPQTVSHAEPRPGRAQRRTGHGLRQHGGRRTTANSISPPQPDRRLRHRIARRHHPPALAAWTHLLIRNTED